MKHRLAALLLLLTAISSAQIDWNRWRKADGMKQTNYRTQTAAELCLALDKAETKKQILKLLGKPLGDLGPCNFTGVTADSILIYRLAHKPAKGDYSPQNYFLFLSLDKRGLLLQCVHEWMPEFD